jgi:hypothetical protein
VKDRFSNIADHQGHVLFVEPSPTWVGTGELRGEKRLKHIRTHMLPHRLGKIGRTDSSAFMRPAAVVATALAAVALMSACTSSAHKAASHSQTPSSSPVGAPGTAVTSAPASAPAPGSSAAVASSAATNDVVSTTTPAPSGASTPSPKPTTGVGVAAATHTPVPKLAPSPSSRGIVPAPSGGDVSQLVTPTAIPTTAAPVALQAPAKVNSVVVSLVTIKAITVGVSGPGEVAGPALAVTVNISNNSNAAVDVSSAVVTLLDAQGQEGTPTPASPAAPFTGSLQPGASANGVYVFNIAKTQRNPINVLVSYTAGAATAQFFGNAS